MSGIQALKTFLNILHNFLLGASFRAANSTDPFSRASLQPIADYIQSHITSSPDIGIICGSGLGELANLVENPVILPYSSIPGKNEQSKMLVSMNPYLTGFPVSTAPGHSGRLVFGLLAGANVVIMQGRLHAYEGHPLWHCTLPVRIFRMLGVKHLIVTNAVGGLNPKYKVTQISKQWTLKS